MKNKEAKCKNCGSPIDMDQILVEQFEQSIRKELTAELDSQQQELKKKQEEFVKTVKKFAQQKEQMEQTIDERVNDSLKSRLKVLKESVRKEIEDEASERINDLEQQLIGKSKQLKSLNKTKAELVRLQRELEEKETEIILKKEKEFEKRLAKAEEKFREQADQESEFKIKEREKVINDLKDQLKEAQRRAEQGSVQLQGEIMELQIKEALEELYPNDDISQSKKGATGADILQIIKTPSGVECGKIYYESKRTKTFSGGWIPKLKQDNRKVKAEICVLVTRALPKGVEKWAVIDEVWVTSYSYVKELSLVLRYGLLKVHAVKQTQTGKESKMELLYNYLTSNEFKDVFESILDGFKKIQESHQSEKLKMQRLWKLREKQLEQILSSAVEFHGSLKGIAGNAIQDIKLLDDPSQKAG